MGTYGIEAIQALWGDWSQALKSKALEVVRSTLPVLFGQLEEQLWMTPDGYLFL